MSLFPGLREPKDYPYRLPAVDDRSRFVGGPPPPAFAPLKDYKRFFASARPEAVFRQRSNTKAFSEREKTTAVLIFQGRNFAV